MQERRRGYPPDGGAPAAADDTDGTLGEAVADSTFEAYTPESTESVASMGKSVFSLFGESVDSSA